MGTGKNWLEVVLMPIVIAAVGIIGTYFITEQQAEESSAQAIASLLSENRVTVDPVHIPGYETSVAIRPNHFEIWLAAGGS